MNKKTNAASTVSFIFITMLLAKVLGQVREIVIAGIYGTMWQADAYVAASQIPTNFFDMILGSAVTAAFIPVYNKYMEKDGVKRANLFGGIFFNNILLISVVLSVLGVIFAPGLISLFTPGLDGNAAFLASKLLKIMFPMIIFISSAYTFVGVLQSMGEYNLPAVMSMVSSLTVIIYLLTLENKFGITGLSVSLVLGWALQFVILVPSALKKGFRFNLKIKDKGMGEVVKLALPVLVGTWVQPINIMVNTIIASSLVGGVSAINYANKLYIIAAGVFAMSVTNYIFPKLSRLSISSESADNWNEVFYSSLKTIFLVVTPIAAVFLTQSNEIIRVIYQRGEFGETSVLITGGALMFYSIGILPYALQEVMYKSFYSLRKSVTPMFIALSGIVVNIVLSFALSRFMGINGLALSASISVILTSVISFVILSKRGGGTVKFLFEALKILIIGVISAYIMYILKPVLISLIGIDGFTDRLFVVGITSLSGIIAYFLLTIIFKVPEIYYILRFFRKGDKDEK